MSNTQDKDFAVPHQQVMQGFKCPDCDYFIPVLNGQSDYHIKQITGSHCRPRICSACNQPHTNKPYIDCGACRVKAEQAKWEAAERIEVPADAMIFASAWDEFYTSVGDFLDNVVYRNDDRDEDEPELTPASARPYVCVFRQARMPNIAEHIADAMPDDDHGGDVTPGWLEELQAYAQAQFNEHKPGAWHPGKQVPAGLPDSVLDEEKT